MHTQFHALTNFHLIRPKYESTHLSTLDWLIAAHTKAESVKNNSVLDEKFHTSIEHLLHRVGCKPTIIHTRGHEIADFLHHRWQDMLVYRLDEFPQGVGLQARQEIATTITDELFDRFYPDQANPPENLIHVSCTAYSAPSSAQKLVSKKKLGQHTTVTHAYHMGCYGSIPGIRMGSAFLAQRGIQSDIVHTELCSLHINPLLHAPDQLVAQSLFADGFIKYSVVPDNEITNSSLRILAINELIIPDSLDAMTWQLSDWGFRFALSRTIPKLIGNHIQNAVRLLCTKAGISEQDLITNGIFAIHPGGPKILDDVQAILGLQPEQLAKSRDILKRFGNMSSATLPHIWESIVSDSTIPNNTKIISLAFGPGLTIAAILLEKI